MSTRAADSHPPTAGARPFLKWVGGKRQIIEALLDRVPKKGLDQHTYYEPFLGGGALFFALRPHRAVLADNNARLVRTYKGVRDRVEEVIRLLQSHRDRHSREFFQEMREIEVDFLKDDAQVAAWMIYLNKTAYNGLYRVNSRNIYNVPFGRYANPPICDEPNLRACSALLQGVTIEHGDFAEVCKSSTKGDFVYFDPPYVPLSATSYFTSYTADGFTPEDQVRLRDVALKLKRKGVRVLLSNSGAGFVREIYGKDFEIEEVEAFRHVNCQVSGRGKVRELLLR